MTDVLTEKQRYAREYYAKNAERIRAKKRDEYHARAQAERKALPKARPFDAPIKVSPTKKKAADKQQEPGKPRKLSARERLENMRIEKEFDDLDVLGGFNENA